MKVNGIPEGSQPQIDIIGAGALGMLLAAYAHMSRIKVRFVTRRREHAEAIKNHGVRVRLYDGQQVHMYPQAVAADELQGVSPADIVIITVKQTHLTEVLDWIDSHIDRHSILFFLLNGLGHPELIDRRLVDFDQILYGVTQRGATRVSDTETVEKGQGMTRVGSCGGKEREAGLNRLISVLGTALDLSRTSSIEKEMWQKAIINACINPLTALFEVPNGRLIQSDSLKRMMKQLFEELIPLVNKVWPMNEQSLASDGEHQGIDMGQVWFQLQDVCLKTADNHSSMLQDIQQGRSTEIEAINGFFIRKAAEYGIKLPSHQLLREAIYVLTEKGRPTQ